MTTLSAKSEDYAAYRDREESVRREIVAYRRRRAEWRLIKLVGWAVSAITLLRLALWVVSQ